MARKPEEISDPQELATFYLGDGRVPLRLHDAVRLVDARSADAEHQSLAPGFPIGKRFKSRRGRARVRRQRRAPGPPREGRRTLARSTPSPTSRRPGRSRSTRGRPGWPRPTSPIARHTPAGADVDAVFDVKVDLPAAVRGDRHHAGSRACSRPRTGPLELTDWEKVYAAGPSAWTDRRHLRRARAVARRRRRRGAPRPVRRGGAAAHGDGRARGVLRRARCCRSSVPRRADAAAEQRGCRRCCTPTYIARCRPVRDKNDKQRRRYRRGSP